MTPSSPISTYLNMFTGSSQDTNNSKDGTNIESVQLKYIHSSYLRYILSLSVIITPLGQTGFDYFNFRV